MIDALMMKLMLILCFNDIKIKGVLTCWHVCEIDQLMFISIRPI